MKLFPSVTLYIRMTSISRCCGLLVILTQTKTIPTLSGTDSMSSTTISSSTAVKNHSVNLEISFVN